jgi:hypothetical protein
MYSCLLKKLVPFALTFVVGAAIGGLFNSFGWRSTPAFGGLGVGPSYRFERRYSCRMHARDLVAETKPLVILFKPDAHWPSGLEAPKSDMEPVLVNVTFGADGKVSYVKASGGCFSESAVARLKPVRDAVERAAFQIQFEPEMVNSVPVSVTKEVEIHFIDDGRQ